MPKNPEQRVKNLEKNQQALLDAIHCAVVYFLGDTHRERKIRRILESAFNKVMQEKA